MTTSTHTARVKKAELLSFLGAGVLGAGIALLLSNQLAPYAILILLLGLISHAVGMSQKHGLEQQGKVIRIWWAEALYGFFWLIELIGDACWKIYQYWGRVGRFIGRFLSRRGPIKDHASRVAKDGSWPMSFPFNPPGYRALYVPTQGGLGFNVIRCLVAEYFQARGASELAVSTWCMLDDFRWFSSTEEK